MQQLQHAEPVSSGSKTPTAQQHKSTIHSWQRAAPCSLSAAAALQTSAARNLSLTPVSPKKPAQVSSAEAQRRSVSDMGLLHGTSARVSWAAGGIFIRLGEFQPERQCRQHVLPSTYPSQASLHSSLTLCSQMALASKCTGSALLPPMEEDMARTVLLLQSLT
jgi:hypothetical protein